MEGWVKFAELVFNVIAAIGGVAAVVIGLKIRLSQSHTRNEVLSLRIDIEKARREDEKAMREWTEKRFVQRLQA